MNIRFSLLRRLVLFLALLHHSLRTTLALVHMLNKERREQEKMASGGMRFATYAITAAANQGVCQ